MTTRQRLDLLAKAFPTLFPRKELRKLLQTQLGHVDALDRWIVRHGKQMRARPPKLIYHICAGNLAVSAWTSLAHGLLLGAQNVIKLPSEREDSSARAEIIDFIAHLPSPLRRLVETHRTIDDQRFAEADVIVVFGSDATLKTLRARTRPDQRFIGHGHAVSLLWLANPDRMTSREFDACAVDVLTYDQLGCLSPQAVYFPTGTNVDALGQKLAQALERVWRKTEPIPKRGLAVAARITEARDLAAALGHGCWLPHHLGWTVIHDPDPMFKASPLHGTIYLRQVSEKKLESALAPVAGKISTVGLAGKTSSRLRDLFFSLGVSRFCEAGRMQFPPLSWQHDGRAALGDLVTWTSD